MVLELRRHSAAATQGREDALSQRRNKRPDFPHQSQLGLSAEASLDHRAEGSSLVAWPATSDTWCSLGMNQPISDSCLLRLAEKPEHTPSWCCVCQGGGSVCPAKHLAGWDICHFFTHPCFRGLPGSCRDSNNTQGEILRETETKCQQGLEKAEQGRLQKVFLAFSL